MPARFISGQNERWCKVTDFRSVFLPYCIKKLTDGRYVVLNRKYKPLGFSTSEKLDYKSYPITVKMRGLKAKTAVKLSWNGDNNTDEIFLYNDGCVPTKNEKFMSAYLERLKILSAMKVDAN